MPQFVVMFALTLTEYHFKILGDEKRVFLLFSHLYFSQKKMHILSVYFISQ